MFAVVVTFQIIPGSMHAFLPHINANAKASKETEPGCLQFDVATDPDRPNEVFLYELYLDAAAFDAHCNMPHYATCGAAVGDMIADKTVATYAKVIR